MIANRTKLPACGKYIQGTIQSMLPFRRQQSMSPWLAGPYGDRVREPEERNEKKF